MSSKLTVITLAALLMFPLSAAAAGFTINPTGGLTTTEDGGTATFTVNLTTQPVGNVTIGVSSSDTTEGTVSPSELTFTSANYSTPQTVTVTGFDDNIIDGDRPYTVVLEVAASTDPDYNLLDPPDVSVTSTDTDTAGFSITPATGLTTEEDGTQATFTVRLVSRPTADVTISISSSDTSEGTVLPTTLTFTPANWNGVQTVTVTGVDDSSVDGDQDYSIVMGAASSSDANYNGIDPGDVSVTNVDNNSAGFTVTPVTGLVTTELGGTATFTVKLNGQPAENVTFDINSSDEAEGTVSPSSLTFTSLNWNAEQTVTVTGVADGLVDGDQSYTVILDTAYSSDPNYDGLDPDDVSLTNTDTDSPGFYIVQVGPMDPVTGYLMTTEDGDYATFTVNLTSKPTNRVYIDVDSGTYSEGMVMPGTGCTLLFTPTNWKVPQTVTVMGTDDFMNPVTDGNQIYIVDLFPDTASLDPLYDDNDPGEITMINIDNETAGFQTGVVSGNTTEAGGTATFTVELISQPQNNVTIVVTTLDNTEGSALPTSLTFTTADWDTNQTVTVTGVNDSIADGDQSFYVRLDPSLSADTVYKGLSPQNVSLLNEDDDTAGVAVTPTSGLTTTEDGGTATFEVVLDSQPEADVTIGLNSSDVAEGTVSPSTLTFTATNWNAPQTVTVTGVDDSGFIDGDQPYTVVLNTAASSDSNYYGLDPDDVSVTNTDNDSEGFLIGSIIGDTFQKGVISGDTTEDGDAASFIVRLTSEPSDDVTIGVTTSDDTEGTVSPSQLTFTSLNWNAEQVVTATGKNDDLTDGNITYYVILSDATSTDSDYSGLTPSPDTVSVVNTDSNAPGFRTEPVSGLTTTEDGGTATFTVRLNGIPTADVTIGVSSSDTTEGTVDVISLTFTSVNWNANQTVTVKGVNDDIIDGNQGYDIVLSSAASSDNNYNGLNPQDVSVSNTDNNTPGFMVGTISGDTTEAGVTATFTVKLQSQPIADVTIGVSSSDTGEGTVDVSSLTFTSVNWNANQTVTVTGVNDNMADGDQSYNIVLAEATSTDSDYNGVNPPDVSLKNTDNNTAGFIVEAISGDTTESSGTATFTVTLQSQPTADVTIGISSSDDEEGTADLTSLTFTAANWNATSHIVTVTGEDDSITDGDQEYSIILSIATSPDLGYNGRDPDDVTVVNIDDDIPGFIVGAGGDTSEDGGTEGFTVSLQSQPTADVTISVTSENTEEGTVNKSSLVFTPDNWNANQTVTVSGIDDSIIDGNQNYTVALGSAVSDDDNYKDLNPPDVVMTNIDNDTAGFIVGTIDDDTTEDGGTAVFSVRLKTKPAVNVSVNVESQNTGEGTASPSTLLFTPDDWSILHYVTITGIDDDIMDGTQPYNIVLSAAVSSDGNYNNVTPSPNSIAVNNLDNDSPGFIIYPNTGLTTTEDGGTDSFTVRLISQPIADVTIGISSLDDSEGSVSPASLTFKSTNWNTEQPVTVTGLDDSIADGNQSYTIVTTEAVSTDPDYSGQYPGNVAAVNIDNDSAVCDVSGDIDGNRRVDLADAILGLRILAGIDYSVNIACDVNGDGQISIEDVLYALRKELGME